MADEKTTPKRATEVDKLKRQVTGVVEDLHARKLAVPAGILLVLILAAVFVLPKSPSPPPPAQTANAGGAVQPKLAEAANLTLVDAVPLDEKPRTYGSENPFSLDTNVACRVTKSSNPRRFACVIGSSLVTYQCMASDDTELCKDSGSTGESGASGTTGEPGGTKTPGTDTPPAKKKAKSTYYVVDVKFNGKTVKGVEAGDQLPTSGTAIVFYAGPTSSAKKAVFVLGDGMTVQGARPDPDLGNFEISAGDDVVLTDTAGQNYTLSLNKIRKVTK